MDTPPVPPEAVLIRLAREAAGITVSDAAKAAGISKARWSQIETARETRAGVMRPVRAKAGTMARMAAAVRLGPERLETDGKRPDAAAVLAEIQRPDERAGAPAVLPPLPAPEAVDPVAVYERDLLAWVLDLTRELRRDPSSSEIFPRDEEDKEEVSLRVVWRGIWDNDDLDQAGRIRMIARVMAAVDGFRRAEEQARPETALGHGNCARNCFRWVTIGMHPLKFAQSQS